MSIVSRLAAAYDNLVRVSKRGQRKEERVDEVSWWRSLSYGDVTSQCCVSAKVLEGGRKQRSKRLCAISRNGGKKFDNHTV